MQPWTLLCQWFHTRYGKLRRPQATALPPSAHLLEQECHSKKLVIVTNPSSRAPTQRFYLKGEAGRNRQLLIFTQRNRFHLQQSLKKFKPKCAPQNTGKCGKRQLGGDSRYRLQCRLASLQERTVDKSGEALPGVEQISNSDLKNYTFKGVTIWLD